MVKCTHAHRLVHLYYIRFSVEPGLHKACFAGCHLVMKGEW